MHGGVNTSPGPAGARPNISLAAKSWATPDCNTSTYSNGRMGPNIREQASQWLTPNVPNGGRSVSAELVASKGMTEDGEKKTVGLESQTRHWPTPAARDSKGANSAEHALVTGGGRKHMDQLSNFVAHSSHQAQLTQDGPPSSSSGPGSPRRLNAEFAGWLMGWRLNWTHAEPHAFGASETELWRSALRQQLCSFFDGQDL